jgi:hypothetical protein
MSFDCVAPGASLPFPVPRGLRFLVLAIAVLSSCTISAAAKTLQDVKARSRAEQFVVAGLRESGRADLGNLPKKDRELTGDFLRTLFFEVPESEIPAHKIFISGATIDDALRFQGEYAAPVPHNIIFVGCTFNGSVAFFGARFERGLTFSRSKFKQGLLLQRVHVKSDVLLSRISVEGDLSGIRLDGAHIEGQLTMQGLNVSAIEAPGMKLQSLRLDLDKDAKLGSVNFSQLESESVTIGRGRNLGFSQLQMESMTSSDYGKNQGSIGILALQQANITDRLLLEDLDIDEVWASGLRIGGRTEMVRSVRIRNLLDFSSTSLGFFQWRVQPCKEGTQSSCWPGQMRINGLSFREINVGQDHMTSAGDAAAGPSSFTSTESSKDMTFDFFERATFSESAFSTYEQLLRSRGLVTDADDVYFAMRERRRTELWQKSKGSVGRVSGAALYIVLDLVQKLFLGYGRSAIQPMVWSLVFVILGTITFWDKKRMEAHSEHPPRYSGFWYSLELFLPVVDLGVAKSWRPSQSSLPLLTYGRIHQLAGWILIPVALAALTGAFK